jgi:competence protein ComEC
VLHPDEQDAFSQADDVTLVLLGKIDGLRVLLLSDLGKPGQSALLQRHPGLRADVIVSGLPAQSEPLAEALIDALEAQLIIITDAEYSATARASRRLQERLSARALPVLYTRETGAVMLEFRKGRCEVRGADGTALELKRRASVSTRSALPAPGEE